MPDTPHIKRFEEWLLTVEGNRLSRIFRSENANYMAANMAMLDADHELSNLTVDHCIIKNCPKHLYVFEFGKVKNFLGFTVGHEITHFFGLKVGHHLTVTHNTFIAEGYESTRPNR